MIAPLIQPEFAAQTLVRVAEVVETADEVHTGRQGGRRVPQVASAAGEVGAALTEGGIQPFNESGILMPSVPWLACTRRCTVASILRTTRRSICKVLP